MKQMIMLSAILTTFFFAGCHSSNKVIVPLSTSIEPDNAYAIIWNGTSKAYRNQNGTWVRDEAYDYQFNVVQKRYLNQWKSIKTLHRLHPGYDGKAGDRDQTMYFDVAYKSIPANNIQATIVSSLGNGAGKTDQEFRKTQLEMRIADPGLFMPYNKIRITQHYKYEEGVLNETVELIKEKDGKDLPFMKNEETAFIFSKSQLDKAPTIFQGVIP